MLDAAPIHGIKQLLQDYGGPWWIAGGWAVDMHLGRVSRRHDDLEIALPRDSLARFHRYLGQRAVWSYAKGGQLCPLDPQHIPALPVHEFYATIEGFGPLEVLLNEGDEANWHYRRDKTISLPWTAFESQSPSPLPAEVVLLYKSKRPRPKDEADFQSLLPQLTAFQKHWLSEAITRTLQSEHPWVAFLQAFS